jgi:hypothetical protein
VIYKAQSCPSSPTLILSALSKREIVHKRLIDLSDSHALPLSSFLIGGVGFERFERLNPRKFPITRIGPHSTPPSHRSSKGVSLIEEMGALQDCQWLAKVSRDVIDESREPLHRQQRRDHSPCAVSTYLQFRRTDACRRSPKLMDHDTTGI